MIEVISEDVNKDDANDWFQRIRSIFVLIKLPRRAERRDCHELVDAIDLLPSHQ